jgi:hypothetical protein
LVEGQRYTDIRDHSDYINKEQQGSVLDIFHLNNLTVDDNINDLVGCAKDTPGLDSRDSTRGSK